MQEDSPGARVHQGRRSGEDNPDPAPAVRQAPFKVKSSPRGTCILGGNWEILVKAAKKMEQVMW